jgi:alkylation response protein AidB-like acyl-CoA dehydrogenase
MRFSFTDDQRAFAEGLREMLARECPLSLVRGTWDDGSGHSPALWSRLDEMGVLSMLVPEADGGMGGSLVDAVLLFQELGRAGVPGPVIEHMIAAPWCAGSSIATTWLDGEPYVAHAPVADAVLTPEGVRTFFTIAKVDGIDGGRRLATIGGGTTTALPDLPVDVVRDQLTVATAAFLIGLGERMIDIAGEYARQREQFGKPIGAFQAVKHLLANALLKVEFAKAPTYRAAWSLATGADTAARDASMAKVMANEAAYLASRAAMQVHGGIGYTWEADLQLLMKKAWALSRAHGDTRTHRRRVAAAVLPR